MNAYLFTAAVTCSGVLPTAVQREGMVDMQQTWETFACSIIYGGVREVAQQQFEAGLRAPSPGPNPIETTINQVVSARVVEHLFTESGHEPIDWPRLAEKLEATVPDVEVEVEDGLAAGYWADANQLVRPENLPPDIESLRQSLPEDVVSGLNWSPGKQFYFLVSILTQPPPPVELEDLQESKPPPDEIAGDEETGQSGESPQAAAKLIAAEAYAGVLARNTVVAAWLWRKFAATTSLAANEIEVSEWRCYPAPFEIVKEQ